MTWLETTTLTVFGLPALTWALLTTGAIAIRGATSTDLHVQTPSSLHISLLFGVMLGGVAAVYLATAGGYSTLWSIAAYVTVTGITIFWYWLMESDTVDTPTTT
ncbi:uncharacterized protein BN903_143 [Halorubrum sp. AJ67]|nr:uncharacterized protein BN903_143 [Halorubrum sp. AJ67]